MTTEQRDATSAMDEIMRTAPVIPVLTIECAEHAVPLARALVQGGLPVLEVTLRTPAAIEGAKEIAEQVPEAVAGIGTILSATDLQRACDIGARFGVSPGLTSELAEAAKKSGLPFLPAVATASELMQALAYGFRRLKFFPAEPAGGTAALRAFAGPFPDVAFCPTGGVGEGNLREYLALPNVLCVGGSWLAKDKELTGGAWEEITARAGRAREIASVASA